MISLNKFLCFLGLAFVMSISADSVVVDAAASALAVTTQAQARLVAAKEQASALMEKVKLAVAALQKDGQNASASADLKNAIAGKVDSTAQVPQSTTAPIVPPAYQGPTSSTWIAPIVPAPGQTTK